MREGGRKNIGELETDLLTNYPCILRTYTHFVVLFLIFFRINSFQTYTYTYTYQSVQI